MRAASLWILLGVMGAGCGVPTEEVDALRKDVVRLRGEVREARKEAARAREEMAALNLKAEVHAFLQNDKALEGDGRFPAMAERVRRESRSLVYALPAGSSRALYFKMGYKLLIDFVAGSGSAGEIGNRLEVFTRNESFTPLNVQANEYGAYVLEEGQVLSIRTTEPVDGGGKKRKRKKRAPLDASEVQLRYLPAAGASSRRVAYVRVIFAGPAADEDGDSDDDDDDDDGAGGDGDGDDGDGYDFSGDDD